ncbi:alpha/beta hydrolase-fold protein [Nocardiopsis sp. LOL_012]|uniref:alpha/beta hydrolase-fold protein n=1 Tax=Nocardiopsis sp. LOL_012 TaxID=3345409 RepID=UPI003A83EBEC
MFASFSRPVLVLVCSCAVFASAALLAIAPPGQLAERIGRRLAGPAPEAGAGEMRPPSLPNAAVPAPIPAPGQVAVCDEAGRDEVVNAPDSAAPGGERKVWIRRPPGPDSADLPVLYLLHGSASTHETLMEEGVGALLDEQMCRTGVEFVIAAPDVRAAPGAATGRDDAADGSFALESFVTGAAVRAVEGEHVRPRKLRALGGFATGGYGAAAVALRNPGLYTQVASWSGRYRGDGPEGFGDSELDRLLDSRSVGDLRFVLVEDARERTPPQEEGDGGGAAHFAGLLDGRGMTVATLRPRGEPGFPAWKRAFPGAAEFLVSGWTLPS